MGPRFLRDYTPGATLLSVKEFQIFSFFTPDKISNFNPKRNFRNFPRVTRQYASVTCQYVEKEYRLNNEWDSNILEKIINMKDTKD